MDGFMISLRVRDSLKTRHLHFSKSPIVIGKATEKGPDVPLSSPTLKMCHVLIMEKEGKYTISNEANDPFVTLNGLPFGKRTLKQGDKLTIHEVEIFVENFALDVVSEHEASSSLSPHFHEASELSTPLPDGDRPAKEIPHEELKDSLTPPWKKYQNQGAFFTICLLILGLAIFSMAHLAIREKGTEQELQAGRGIADAGMAFLQARLYRENPLQHGGLNNDFLKENLSSVLAEQFRPLCELDAQGRFVECPYILRFYTTENRSRFLLVAQPTSGFFDWWIRKGAIVLDSQEMTIRKIANVKELNRLLVNRGTLDEIDSHALQTMIQHGDIVSLADLGKDEKYHEFSPPEGLAFIQPGAENFLYNAPRYYKFTEDVVDLAAAWQPGNKEQEDHQLRERLRPLFALPQLVLYTTQGMEVAIQAHRGLSFVAPTEGYLLGYLTLNPDTKKILRAQLLMTKNSRDPDLAMNSPPPSEIAASFPPPTSSQVPKQEKTEWFKRMKMLAYARQQALEPYLEEMTLLLDHHLQEVDPLFKDRFHLLLLTYEQVDVEQQAKIRHAIPLLYKEYQKEDPEASSQKFLNYVQEAGLEPCLEKGFKLQLAIKPRNSD